MRLTAGIQPSQVNPYAIKVMKEIGIDISKQRSKSVEEFRGEKFDLVATVCDQAKEACPFFPGGKKFLHKGFKDPSQFKGTEEEILAEVRRVRDEIKDWIEKVLVKNNG